MKRSLLVYLVALIFIFTACGKTNTYTCDPTPPAAVASSAEISAIQNYLNANGISATQDPSGFFYQILNPGTGTVTPTVCSNVTVTYIGTLMGGNGAPFDSNTTGVSFPLGNLIIGWQKGIPLIKKGGSIKLFIPPSMGYGASASGSIPANSYLIFNVSLLDVAN